MDDDLPPDVVDGSYSVNVSRSAIRNAQSAGSRGYKRRTYTANSSPSKWRVTFIVTSLIITAASLATVIYMCFR